MNPLETIFAYHERTKHHPGRYAASLGYMDWATQPDPFRHYDGAPLQPLPLTLDAATPAYDRLFLPGGVPPEPLNDETLSRLLQFSLGLAAWKSIGADRWALRCNASSGNLHPTEVYLLLPPSSSSPQSRVVHYAPEHHALETLAAFTTAFWDQLPEGSLLLALNSVPWREAWKYGERAFRYCLLDAGHARRAVEVSAAMLGWEVTPLDVETALIERLTGADRKGRFHPMEGESADVLLLISPQKSKTPDCSRLPGDLPDRFEGTPRRLSPSHHRWEAVDLAAAATRSGSGGPFCPFSVPERRSAAESKRVVLERRSARAMDPRRALIGEGEFRSLLASVAPALPETTPVHFLIFLHRVEGLEPGLYLQLRNPEHFDILRRSTRDDFLWRNCGDGLYLLEPGEFRAQAAFISCSQEIASDGAFSLGMLCEFRPQLEAFGARRYRELFAECGAIGQQLYLEATSVGLSATGIGCFLDDVVHRTLGLEEDRFQSLYHFTVGRAIPDLRLTTLPPYGERNSER